MKVKENIMETLSVIGNLSRENDYSSGYGLFAKNEIYIPPGRSRLVSTGVIIKNMPKGLCAYVMGMSELLARHSVICTPTIVDADYLGEIRVAMHNSGTVTYQIHQGMKIARMIFSLSVHPQISFHDLGSALPQASFGGNRVTDRITTVS